MTAEELQPADANVQFDEVPPDASALIESMRAYGYSVPTAIADLVDNSIAAGCSTVWIHFEWSGADSWMSLTDDGSGMSEDELRTAMKLGSTNPREERQAKDLGRFGLGLKTASLSQCRRLTVTTRTDGGAPATRRWDLDHLAQDSVQGWQLLYTPFAGSGERASLPADLDHGTVVLWEDLDRLVGAAGKADKAIHRHFKKTIEHVETHLGMVFHSYLSTTGKRLKIFVNGEPVVAWDPFLEDHPATQNTPTDPIQLPGHDEPIRIQGFVLPHKDRLGDALHAEASGPAGWNSQQGFYVYRNNRLIVAGHWLGLGAGRPWTKEEHYKLARIRLDIPNSMDHLWHLDVKKSSAQPPPQAVARLKGLAQTVRQQAREVFAHRGRPGSPQEKRELRRPWIVKQLAGAVVYRVDRKHPVVKGLLGDLPPSHKNQVETMLRIIEETVPVQQIWLDMAEDPDSVAMPFHGSTSRQRTLLIRYAYDAVRRNREVGHEEAIALLQASEEFADVESRAIIATLTEEDL